MGMSESQNDRRTAGSASGSEDGKEKPKTPK